MASWRRSEEREWNKEKSSPRLHFKGTSDRNLFLQDLLGSLRKCRMREEAGIISWWHQEWPTDISSHVWRTTRHPKVPHPEGQRGSDRKGEAGHMSPRWVASAGSWLKPIWDSHLSGGQNQGWNQKDWGAQELPNTLAIYNQVAGGGGAWTLSPAGSPW
jgi:hypothetical protein